MILQDYSSEEGVKLKFCQAPVHGKFFNRVMCLIQVYLIQIDCPKGSDFMRGTQYFLICVVIIAMLAGIVSAKQPVYGLGNMDGWPYEEWNLATVLK